MIDRFKTCYNAHDSSEYTSGMFVSAVAWNLLRWKNVEVQRNHTLSSLASLMAHFSNHSRDFEACFFIGSAGTSRTCGNESSKV